MWLLRSGANAWTAVGRLKWKRSRKGCSAAEIDSVLRDNRLKTFFDRRNLATCLPWIRALEQALGAAKAAIVLLGL